MLKEEWVELHTTGYGQDGRLGQFAYTGSPNLFVFDVRARCFRDGVSNPAWKSQIIAGQDATTTLVAEERSFTARKGAVQYVLWGDFDIPESEAFWRRLEGFHCPPVDILFNVGEYPFQQTDAEALAKLYQRIQETRTAFQGGVFLGELRETLRMLKSPLKGLRDGFSSYFSSVKDAAQAAPRFRRKIQRIKHISGALASLWLELAFGVKPLLSDISDAKEALIQLHSQPAERRSVRVTKQRATSSYSAGTLQPYYAIFDTQTTSMVIRAVRVVYRAGLECAAYDAAINTGERWRQRFGLNLENFIPTLYEICPWSFVVDYFSNLGDIITALSFDRRGVLWVNRTIIYEAFNINTMSLDRASTLAHINGGNPTYVYRADLDPYLGSCTSRLKRVVRQSVGLGIPSLITRTPAADSLKWVNLAALAVGLASANKSVRQYING